MLLEYVIDTDGCRARCGACGAPLIWIDGVVAGSARRTWCSECAVADPPPAANVVHSPDHYTDGGLETRDIIKAKGFSPEFELGNVIKYVTRCQHKGSYLEDLKKARKYLDFLISDEEDPDGSNNQS